MEKLRSVVEMVPNGIVILDQAGKITLCNAQTEEIFGYRPGELLGKGAETLVPAKSWYKSDQREFSGVRKDGSVVPLEVALNPMQDDSETFVIASIVDITERRTEEERFRTILDSDDLLELSRIGRMELHCERFPLGELLDEVCDGLSERISQKDIQISIDPTLPKILADRKRTYQVFENLIGNSIKYGADVPELKIEISGVPSADGVQICVRDNGPGIEPEFHKKIFGLFQRLDSSKEGTGVGLTIVSRIMQLHGGLVWVESTKGAGSAFWLSFPKEQTTTTGEFTS